jgi:aspartate racemase
MRRRRAALAMTLHIGIVCCSAEGASLCYRTLCSEGAQSFGRYGHPEISTHTPSFADYMTLIEAGDWQGVAELMLASATKLAAIGADFVICPDNTIHQALPRIRARSPVPWLSIAEVVASTARERGYRRVGVMGTQWLVASAIYPEALESQGIECVRPDHATRALHNRIIMDELVAGVFHPESVAAFQRSIEAFKGDGCDAVILGCTEIPLIIDDSNAALPTLDSTRLLARAALRRAAT